MATTLPCADKTLYLRYMKYMYQLKFQFWLIEPYKQRDNWFSELIFSFVELNNADKTL